MDVTADWYWEGNVVEAIARFLAHDGWTVVAKADTHSKKRGVDNVKSDNGIYRRSHFDQGPQIRDWLSRSQPLS